MSNVKPPEFENSSEIAGSIKPADDVGSCTVCRDSGSGVQVAEFTLGSMAPRLCKKCLEGALLCINQLWINWTNICKCGSNKSPLIIENNAPYSYGLQCPDCDGRRGA